MVKCQECGEEVGDALICNVCGSRIKQPTDELTKRFCTHCGAEMSVNDVVCPKCGKSENDASSSKMGNTLGNNLIATFNPGTGFLLSLFIVGAGHIYLGLFKRGISFLITQIVLALIFFGVLNLILGLILGVIGSWIAMIIGFIACFGLYLLSIFDVYKAIKKIINGENVDDDIAFNKLM